MKKLLSVLLAISVSVSTLAAATITASADGTKKTMNMGSGVIAVKDNIYYGNQTKWRVLSTEGNATNGDGAPTFNGGAVAKENALFVISENNFGNRAFDSGNNQMWQTDTNQSEAKQWCNEIEDTSYESNGFYTAAGITAKEQTAILTTSKTDANYSMFGTSGIDDKVFYLSANEAETYFNDSDDRTFVPGGDDAVWWWLRSPYEGYDIVVGFVFDGGRILCDVAGNDSVASRPAFNLNLSSVLFTSAADFDGTVGAYEGNEWKLTLKDSTRSITTGDVSRSGDTLTVAYTGAETGANEKISYIITDKDQKEIKYYGSQAASSASGSVNITLSTMADTDKLFVFSEQDNGAMKINYASELKEVTIPADGFAVTANVNDDTMGSVTVSKAIAKKGESVTLTATANEGYKFTGFTSDVEIYTNGNKGMFTMPDKDVTVTANFAATTGENAITVKSNFAGMGTVTSDKATAAFGEEVTLTAQANDGNSFVEFASPDVEIGEDGKFIMPDKAVYVQAIFKANASFTANETYPIQAQKNTVNGNAVLRFMWDLTKADGAYLANIGAYIFSWDAFNEGSEVKPAIVLVSKPNMVSGNTFSADYIGIPDGKYDTDYCAIPFINGTFFAEAKLRGNVNTYNVDKEAE